MGALRTFFFFWRVCTLTRGAIPSSALTHMSKFGQYEWIADWAELRRSVEEWRELSAGMHCQERGGATGGGGLRALVIGCGTSALSCNLAALGIFSAVVSVDNDAGCIDHMQRQYAGHGLLQWHVYDLVERTGSEAFFAEHQSFDLIVDKGTFDAILVEGVSYPMLCEVHRLLKPDTGCYLLYSIHSHELLLPLFGSPAVGMEVVKMDELGRPPNANEADYEKGGPSGGRGSLLLCRKTGAQPLDPQALAAHEKEVMDFFYQEEQPLLTHEALERAQAAFRLELSSRHERLGWASDSLPLDVAHGIVFSNEALGYSLEMFCSDLRSFPLNDAGLISLPELLAFVSAMQ